MVALHLPGGRPCASGPLIGRVPDCWGSVQEHLSTCSRYPEISRDIQLSAFERCSDLVEPVCAQPVPVRELVASIPAPCCDHREREDPAVAEQVMIRTRIVLADFFGRVGEVELHRSATTRLEIDEQQSVLRGEHVARVRLAVQQLLDTATLADLSSQVS